MNKSFSIRSLVVVLDLVLVASVQIVRLAPSTLCVKSPCGGVDSTCKSMYKSYTIRSLVVLDLVLVAIPVVQTYTTRSLVVVLDLVLVPKRPPAYKINALSSHILWVCTSFKNQAFKLIKI